MRRVFDQIILHLGELEDEYRKEHLRADRAQTIVVALIGAIIMVSMLKADSILFANNPALYSWMVWYRGIYSFTTLLFLIILLTVRDYRIYDRAVFAWALVTAIYLLLFKFIPPLRYFTSAIDVLYPFGVYLLFSFRLTYSIPLAVSFSIGTILINSLYITGLTPIETSFMVNSQILTHILALPSAIQMQSYRRRSFKAYLDQKDAREMANYLINIDTLTKCMTRLYFMDVAIKEYLRARRYKLSLSLLMLDLDRFKKINDNYGHPAGDQVLQRFAAVVLEQKRAQDVFGRLGGEEFGLLLPNTTLLNARLVAERIQQVWADSPVIVDSNEIQCTVSIGVAELDSEDPSFDVLLNRADSLMYKAKRRGRNRVAFK